MISLYKDRITHYISTGVDMAAMDAQNAVVGVLKCLDDKYVHPPPETAVRASDEARTALLKEKHTRMDQKRSERRREVRVNVLSPKR